MKKLTDRQKDVLSFIQQFRDQVGYPPTLREIAKKFGIASTFGVKRHLDALSKKGYLNVESSTSRGITILQEINSFPNTSFRNKFTEINVIGRVAAGSPVQAIENVEGSMVIDSSFVQRDGDYFGLRVKGDSMINAGICEDDIVVVHHTNQNLHNDIVVALIDGEATVKRLEKRNDRIRLIPENDKYDPIDMTDNETFSIIGNVVGVFRWLN
ncbi:MAG: transcriptional repressor LexA [Ignavibacteriaceae bacterium]